MTNQLERHTGVRGHEVAGEKMIKREEKKRENCTKNWVKYPKFTFFWVIDAKTLAGGIPPLPPAPSLPLLCTLGKNVDPIGG